MDSRIKKVFEIRVLLVTLFLIISSVVFCNDVYAQSDIFRDDFGFLNEDIWAKYGEWVNVSGGVLTLGSDTDQFPFLTTSFLISDATKDDFEIEVAFKYNSVQPWGNGITFGNLIPPYPADLGFMSDNNGSIVHFQLWQDSSSGEGLRIKYHHTEDELANEAELFTFSYDDTQSHVLKIIKNQGTYTVLIDDQLLFARENSFRLPTVITLGNPIAMYLPSMWSSFSVDYILIKGIGPQVDNVPPLIIIPGLGASWNTRAIVYDENVSPQAWKMTPFVNTYDRIIKTAEGSGYTLGENLFVWNYDWRKPLSQIALSLDQFIQSESELDSSEKIDLVGHSLGGLVARTWVQTYDISEEKKTNNLITAGSPHQGVVQAYQAVAGGKISEGSSLGWTALQLLLQIKEGFFKTKAEIFRNTTPICYDLIPVFNFINWCGKEEIDFMEIAYPNDFLFQLNQEAEVLPFSSFLIGNSGSNTPEMIFVKDHSVVEEILNLWPDGKPYKITTGEGDDTVLEKSAFLAGGFDPDLEYPLNHGEIISNPEAVEKIMAILGNDDPVILGSDPYPEDGLLIFYLASLATLEVEGLVPEDDDLQFVVIPNPEPRQYQAAVTGTDSGHYQLFVGQATPQGDFWQTYQGETENGKVTNYLFDINPENPSSDPLVDEGGLSRLTEARQLLVALHQKVWDKNTSNSLAGLDSAIKMANQLNWRKTANDLKKSMFYLSNFRRSQTEAEYYAESKTILEKMASGWENVLEVGGLESSRDAEKGYLSAKKELSLALKSIDRLKMRGKEITARTALSVNDSQELADLLTETLSNRGSAHLESYSYLAYLLAREGV